MGSDMSVPSATENLEDQILQRILEEYQDIKYRYPEDNLGVISRNTFCLFETESLVDLRPPMGLDLQEREPSCPLIITSPVLTRIHHHTQRRRARRIKLKCHAREVSTDLSL